MGKVKHQFDVDVESVSHDDLKSLYRRLHASRDGLKKHNDDLSKWASRLNKAVMRLSCEGSLVFQAMAEKAGVRGHPSVSAAVKMFDAVSHPQWECRDKDAPKLEWPDDWSFDGEDEWTGDADMSLNSPLAEAYSLLDSLKYTSLKKDQIERIFDALSLIQKATEQGVQGVKKRMGFKPKQIAPVAEKHYREMSEHELRDLVSAISWMALDLAQDMDFANSMLRRDLRASAYRRIEYDLHRLSSFSMEWQGHSNLDVKVLGGEIPF